MIQAEVDIGELLMHHAADAYGMDIGPWHFAWGKFLPDIHLGPVTMNLTPTKHVVFMLVAAVLVFLTMWTAARSLERQRASEKAPKGFANAVESLALWVRNDVAIASIGHGGEKFAPYIMTLFFFLLYSNLLGLVPWGATPTSNLAVTGGLAFLSLLLIEISGMRALGFRGYMRTIFPPVAGVSGPGAMVLSVAMAPIELLGKIVKPFALCVRLFGNMTAGHLAVLALFGIFFLFANLWYATVWGMWVGWVAAPTIGILVSGIVLLVMVLEIIVAFVQAYVFTLITAVLIGVVRHEH